MTADLDFTRRPNFLASLRLHQLFAPRSGPAAAIIITTVLILMPILLLSLHLLQRSRSAQESLLVPSFHRSSLDLTIISIDPMRSLSNL